jgi:hypothetical protein
MRSPQQFTENKAAARRLQRETIEKFSGDRIGSLRYFGLPSTALADAIEWQDLFVHFDAVERGEIGKEWEMQHDLELMAFKTGLFDKITLFRGDIDVIIRKRRDNFGNRIHFPYDVVSLDYSGGLFYKNRKGDFSRLLALEELIAGQSKAQASFVLLISCNLDSIDQGEVRRTIENVGTELARYGISGAEAVRAYLASPRDEARLKLYVPFFLNMQAAKFHFHCETQPVIFYSGNLDTQMMAFRFYLTYDPRTEALRPPRERLSQLFNKPMLEIVNGTATAAMFDLPKLLSPAQSD